jgi:hypothetical protein
LGGAVQAYPALPVIIRFLSDPSFLAPLGDGLSLWPGLALFNQACPSGQTDFMGDLIPYVASFKKLIGF